MRYRTILVLVVTAACTDLAAGSAGTRASRDVAPLGGNPSHTATPLAGVGHRPLASQEPTIAARSLKTSTLGVAEAVYLRRSKRFGSATRRRTTLRCRGLRARNPNCRNMNAGPGQRRGYGDCQCDFLVLYERKNCCRKKGVCC